MTIFTRQPIMFMAGGGSSLLWTFFLPSPPDANCVWQQQTTRIITLSFYPQPGLDKPQECVEEMRIGQQRAHVYRSRAYSPITIWHYYGTKTIPRNFWHSFLPRIPWLLLKLWKWRNPFLWKLSPAEIIVIFTNTCSTRYEVWNEKTHPRVSFTI